MTGGNERLFCAARRIVAANGDIVERPCNWQLQTGLPCRHALAANDGNLDLSSFPARWRKRFEREDLRTGLSRRHVDTRLGLALHHSVDRTPRA